MSDDLIERLETRAKAAREEGNMTANCDAQHFEEAAARIRELEQGVAITPMPPECAPKGVPLLVAGGIAMKKTGGQWFTGMDEPAFERPIEWEVKWWSPIPQQNEPPALTPAPVTKGFYSGGMWIQITDDGTCETPTPAHVTDEALEPVDRALRHIEGCLTFPVSTEINERGYDTRNPTPETVQYMVDLVREARAALSALAGQGGE